MSPVSQDGDDLVLQLWLQPRGGRDEVIGIHDGAFKVRIGAPPVDGAANERLIRFLADEFGIGRQQVLLEQGHGSRRKRVRVRSPARMPAWARDRD